MEPSSSSSYFHDLELSSSNQLEQAANAPDDEDPMDYDDLDHEAEQDYGNDNQNFMNDGGDYDNDGNDGDYNHDDWGYDDDEEEEGGSGSRAAKRAKKDRSSSSVGSAGGRVKKKKAGSWSKPRYTPKVKKRDAIKAGVRTEKKKSCHFVASFQTEKIPKIPVKESRFAQKSHLA